MCKEVPEEQLLLLERIEDPDELRMLLDEIGGRRWCSYGRSLELSGYDIECLIQHQVKFRNRLLHILNKMGF
jgi:hypothetical protein